MREALAGCWIQSDQVLGHTALWDAGRKDCTSSILWGNPDWDCTTVLLRLSKSAFSRMIAEVDGNICRACGKKNEIWFRHFGIDILPDITHLRGISCRKIRDKLDTNTNWSNWITSGNCPTWLRSLALLAWAWEITPPFKPTQPINLFEILANLMVNSFQGLNLPTA